ncbi:MAG: RMD1 family protein [Bacteroidales bacterium]
MNRFNIAGYHLGERLDLKNLKNSLAFNCIYEDPTELVYQKDPNKYFQVFDYGSIVFFGIDSIQQTDIIGLIRNILEIGNIELTGEFYDVEVLPEAQYKVLFDKIVINELNLDLIKILMLNIAQSAALEYYTLQSNILLSETSKFTDELEEKGVFTIRGKKLLKYIGRTLNLRNKIVNNLYIFDSPKIAWNNEFLNQVDIDMSRELDISLRYRSLQENLNVVKENLEIFKDLNQHSHSSSLEWIIIILIAVEILNLIFEKFF